MAKKRANGEGNIRKRSDGRWEGRYTAGYNPETGKRIIKNVLGKTQAECKAKLAAAMEAGEQSILFLNRRGASRMVTCGECGEVPTCPRCSVHLTYHSANGRLMCHYCGHSEPLPDACPSCGGHNWTDIRQFNLMFKTFQGVTEDAKNTVYLRPETAQGIFVNFQNVQRTTRKKLPFGVCQVGKSFRNEITPGNFTFRTREFEQMELEFFCKPGTELEWFKYWKDFCHKWLLNLGMKDENLRLRDHDPEELSHYSNATTDFEFAFPFGWGELWGVASRTNYDLNAHQTTSGKDQTYFDQESGEHYIPFVIEPSLGADRVTLAFLVDAYDEEVVGQDKNGKDDVRVVLRLHPALAPFKCAVLPLSKKLAGPAQELLDDLSKDFMCDYDDAGSIGKRYRRQDEIGTPYCITVDFDTVGDADKEGDHCVTVRDRDTMEQVRLPISELKAYLREKMAF